MSQKLSFNWPFWNLALFRNFPPIFSQSNKIKSQNYEISQFFVIRVKNLTLVKIMTSSQNCENKSQCFEIKKVELLLFYSINLTFYLKNFDPFCAKKQIPLIKASFPFSFLNWWEWICMRDRNNAFVKI